MKTYQNCIQDMGLFCDELNLSLFRATSLERDIKVAYSYSGGEREEKEYTFKILSLVAVAVTKQKNWSFIIVSRWSRRFFSHNFHSMILQCGIVYSVYIVSADRDF